MHANQPREAIRPMISVPDWNRAIRSAVAGSLLLAPGVTHSQGVDPREQSVSIASGEGRRLAGTLSLPERSNGPFAVAVTITGSGAHLRDGNRTSSDPYRPFREIAGALARRGIATLRLDDRGTGESTGNAAATDGDDVADDVRAAIEWLRRDPRIDAKRVILIGHSFGGVIAPIVASSDDRIAAVVLLGAPARTFRETMRYQLAYTIERNPAIAADARASALEAAMRQQERNASTSPDRWRPWLQNYDPLPVAARVKAPVLICHGTTDRAVPVRDAETLYATMRNAGNAQVRLHVFQELNHHFQPDPVGAREGYYQLPSQALSSEFLEVMSRWVEATVAR